MGFLSWISLLNSSSWTECVSEWTETTSPQFYPLWKLGGPFFKCHGYKSFKGNTGKFVSCEKEHKRYLVKCHYKKDKRKVRQQLGSLSFYWKIRKTLLVMKTSVGGPFHSRSSIVLCFRAYFALSQYISICSSKCLVCSEGFSFAVSLTFVWLSLNLLYLNNYAYERQDRVLTTVNSYIGTVDASFQAMHREFGGYQRTAFTNIYVQRLSS